MTMKNDEQQSGDSLILFILGVAIVLMWALLAQRAALAHDAGGKYAQSELHEWFNGLRSKSNFPCCSFADGQTVIDADWDIIGGENAHYRVRIEGQWFDVPDEAVVTVPNRLGLAVVWPVVYVNGETHVRCFMPGSGT